MSLIDNFRSKQSAAWRERESERALHVSRPRGSACVVGTGRRGQESRSGNAAPLSCRDRQRLQKREPWPDPSYRAGQSREITGMRLAGIPE
jgi:hypothetical protein